MHLKIFSNITISLEITCYTIPYKEYMHKELRNDKQILEELFDAKYLCASFHVKFINCCRDMTPRSGKHHKKRNKCVTICPKIFYIHD